MAQSLSEKRRQQVSAMLKLTDALFCSCALSLSWATIDDAVLTLKPSLSTGLVYTAHIIHASIVFTDERKVRFSSLGCN